MIYFIVGDGVPFQIKYDEILHEIEEKNKGLKKNFYDFSQGDEELFISSVSQISMFQQKEIYILKRFEKLKGIDKFLKVLSQFNLSDREIIVLYEEIFDQYGRREDEKDKPAQDKKKKLLELFKEMGKLYLARVETLKKASVHYVMEHLSIQEKDSEELLNLIGEDYFIIKNEVEKIKSFLNGEEYSLDKIKGVINLKKEFSIIKGVEKLLIEKDEYELQQWLIENKEYIQLIYMLFEELLTYYKITLLQEEGKINYSMDYNSFKERYSQFENLFLNEKTGRAQHSYPIFLKLKVAQRFKSEFLLNKIKKLSEIDYKIKSGTGAPDLELPIYISSFYN